MDLFLRLSSIFIFILWLAYWLITERKADREKPKVRKLSLFHKDKIRKLVLRLAEVALILQLFGLPLFQISDAGFRIQLIGFFLVFMGASIAISARKTLGTNWAHAYEYQIKQKQNLVTTGIYGYIRHPIYTGLILGFIGGELVAKSYLALAVLIIVAGVNRQALLEEKLLLSHFGNKYKKYMKQTRMFIPHLW